jgi:DNA-binding NtrC family response regulator
MSPDGPMRSVLTQAEKMSCQNWPVLIHGETGTGKDLLARLIHAGKGPFVVIDCTHLNPQLAESELFGHTRGAYTGADAERPGLIDAADGGCAFFDEIGELSLESQSKLLRLIQEKTYRRVGSVRQLRSDFRIVAATNRDLKVEVAANRFRQDLYYRLNVAKIRIPPLRERKQDIPLLASYFSSRVGIRLSEDILQVFINHDWPGNVRELENCIYRIAARSTGEKVNLPTTLNSDSFRVQPSALRGPNLSGRYSNLRRPNAVGPSATREGAERPEPDVQGFASAGDVQLDWRRLPLTSLENLERLALLRALHETRGDRTRAALILGIGRATLYRKLQDLERHASFREASDKLHMTHTAGIPG